jgi:mannose-6-phosphate isomerase-like protein (cupin superfamily)
VVGDQEALSPGAGLTRWPHRERPTRRGLEQIFREEGLAPSWWSNGPNDRYGEHSHPYHKVLYCAEGVIRFVCAGEAIDVEPGDRLDIPAGVVHSAVVGPRGVTCVEAARR